MKLLAVVPISQKPTSSDQELPTSEGDLANIIFTGSCEFIYDFTNAPNTAKLHAIPVPSGFQYESQCNTLPRQSCGSNFNFSGAGLVNEFRNAPFRRLQRGPRKRNAHVMNVGNSDAASGKHCEALRRSLRPRKELNYAESSVRSGANPDHTDSVDLFGNFEDDTPIDYDSSSASDSDAKAPSQVVIGDAAIPANKKDICRTKSHENIDNNITDVHEAVSPCPSTARTSPARASAPTPADHVSGVAINEHVHDLNEHNGVHDSTETLHASSDSSSFGSIFSYEAKEKKSPLPNLGTNDLDVLSVIEKLQNELENLAKALKVRSQREEELACENNDLRGFNSKHTEETNELKCKHLDEINELKRTQADEIDKLKRKHIEKTGKLKCKIKAIETELNESRDVLHQLLEDSSRPLT